MLKNSVLFTLMLAFIIFSGCGGGIKTDFTLIDSSDEKPSVVTLKFQLQDSDGVPLPDLEISDFILKEDGELISPFESAMDIVNDPKRFLRATVLLLDMSGSIVNSNNLADLQRAAKSFVTKVTDGQIIAIYTFDGRETLQSLVAFTDDLDDLKDGIDSLTDFEMVDNSTNLNGAIENGVMVLEDKQLKSSSYDIFAGAMVVFTDGKDLAARVSNDKAKKAVQQSDYSVYSVGLGDAVDKGHLISIGKNGAYFAEDSAYIQEAFNLAAEDLKARAESYYIFSYCSPKRDGRHWLELALEGYGGSLRHQFDSDDFEGGCTTNDFLDNSQNLIVK